MTDANPETNEADTKDQEVKPSPNDDIAETIAENDFKGELTLDKLRQTFSNEDSANIINSSTNPVIPGQPILSKFDDPNTTERRYNMSEMLGAGTGGSVYSLLDTNLSRTVAVKFLQLELSSSTKELKRFIHEALITSRLDHPHIPPIYDLDLTTGNQAFYTMKKVLGIPLATLTDVENKRTTETDILKFIQRLESISEVVSIFIKVVETIAYAHSQNIIHRDIKPDNIMVGDYGEVRIVDWGIAFDLKNGVKRNGNLVGTPLYMSPEQANKLMATEQSDIYCIGSTLYHVLFKIPTVTSLSSKKFWDAKRNGTIETLTDIKRASIPAPLLAICLKCLEPIPENRYENAQQIADDLKSFQNGGMINSYKYSTIEVVKYWLLEHKIHVAWGLALLLTIIFTITYMYQQYQKESGDWGDPIYVESFSQDSGWKNDWIISSGTFSTENDKLVTVTGSEFSIYYNMLLEGGTCIEFEGEMLADSPPGDLSVVFTPDVHDFSNGKPRLLYYFQNGAYGNEASAITGPDSRLDYRKKSLKANTTYTIRAEIDGKSLALFINNELICSHDLLSPLNSGYIGLYGYYPGKCFDNVRIYNKRLPQLTNIIKTGDLLYENELYQQAAARYKRIYQVHAKTDIGLEALYKYALCLYRLGKISEAFETWSPLDNSIYKTNIQFYHWDELLNQQQYSTLIDKMNSLYATSSPSRQSQIKFKWSAILQKSILDGNLDLIHQLLTFRDNNFKQGQIFSQVTFDALRTLGQGDRALELFPDQKEIIAQALIENGEYPKIFEKHGNNRIHTGQALMMLGKYDQIIEDYADFKNLKLEALIASGRLEEAKMAYSDDPDSMLRIMLHGTGDFSQALATYPQKGNVSTLYLGDPQAYLQSEIDNFIFDSKASHDARTAIALDLFKENPEESIQKIKLLSQTAPGPLRSDSSMQLAVYFLAPILEHLNGNPTPLQDLLDTIWSSKNKTQGQRLWNCAGIMLSHINEADFHNQPKQRFIDCDYQLFSGIHEDLFGSKQKALNYYKNYLSLPQFKRYNTYSIELFCKQRIKDIRDKR